MTVQKKIEEVRAWILKTANNVGPTDFAGLLAVELASRFDRPERDVREIAESLDTEGHIALSAWDGEIDRPFSEWGPDRFWKSPSESGYKRIRLRLAGREDLDSSSSKRPIGFSG